MTEAHHHHEQGPHGARALSFGAAAEAYDRYRPPYPPELAADVVALAPGRRFAEIGAGTGRATEIFAAHDLDITCVEPDPEMAAVLARKFDGDDRVHVEVSTLEAWRPDGVFDALTCAQAWHWTDPATHWRDTAAALRPGGVLALFWNDNGHGDPELAARMNAVYDRYEVADRPGFTADDPSVITAAREGYVWSTKEIEAATEFGDFEARVYRWTRHESPAELIGRLNTVSAHLILPAETRDALARDLLDAVTARSVGDVELNMITGLFLARRR